MTIRSLVFILLVGCIQAVLIKCPYFCTCDLWNGLRRVTCTDKMLVNYEVNAPVQVEVLELSRNSFSELKNKGFHHYLNLKYLNVSHNKITDMHIHAFDGLFELNILDLSYNHLKYLLPEVFEDTPILQELHLSGNEIGHFGKSPVLHIPSLQKLYMKECWLDSMDEVTFSELPNLTDLDLSDNQFVSLRVEYIRSLSKLNTLILSGNPFYCNNIIQEVMRHLEEKNVAVTPICEKSSNKEIPSNGSDMFERMVSQLDDSKSSEEDELDNIETLDQDIYHIWYGDKPIEDPPYHPRNNETPKMNDTIENLMGQIPALWAFILGLQIGAVLAIMGMWLWLRCKCSQVPAQPPLRPRALSLSQSVRRSVGRLRADENSYTELQTVDCPETPPPAYRDVALRTFGRSNI